jgi:hypothetical protein
MQAARSELIASRSKAAMLIDGMAKRYGKLPSEIMERNAREIAFDLWVFNAGLENERQASS